MPRLKYLGSMLTFDSTLDVPTKNRLCYLVSQVKHRFSDATAY